jgi:hypothetical protein
VSIEFPEGPLPDEDEFGCTRPPDPPIEIHHVCGDIFDFAMDRVQAVVLWLRGGGRRGITWDRIRDRFAQRLYRLSGNHYAESTLYCSPRDARYDAPWDGHQDTLIEICPPERMLRYIYILKNPGDQKGYPTVAHVSVAVTLAVMALDKLGVRSIGMIHIPVSPDGNTVDGDVQQEAAAQMLQTIRSCADRFRSVREVHLVDLSDAFAGHVP